MRLQLIIYQSTAVGAVGRTGTAAGLARFQQPAPSTHSIWSSGMQMQLQWYNSLHWVSIRSFIRLFLNGLLHCSHIMHLSSISSIVALHSTLQ